jgi:2,3-bisphosphoglycerate-independent phosphoglycerate mutase
VRRAHTADPVPLLLSGGPFTADGTPAYSERACARGSLGEQRGIDVLPLVKEAIR